MGGIRKPRAPGTGRVGAFGSERARQTDLERGLGAMGTLEERVGGC